MSIFRGTCANCDTPIVDPTTRVVHGDQAYCCPNCAAAMEETGSGSDPQALRHDGADRCAHCGTPIVHEATVESRGDRTFCCGNCASAVQTSA
jgi:hypothetical protein